MSKRERVRRAIQHKKSDKVPWNIEVTQPVLSALAKYYGDTRLTDHSFFSQWVGNHIKMVMPQSGHQFHGLETEIQPGLWRNGWGIIWDCRGLYGEGEWGSPMNILLPKPNIKNYVFPPPPNPEDFAHFPHFIIKNREYFLVGEEGHLFEVAWALRGMENLLQDMLLHPRFVDKLMRTITEHYLTFIKQAVRYDVNAFIFGDDWGAEQGLIMGPKLWRRFIKPYMKLMFDEVHAANKFVVLHSDGDITEIMPDLIEIGLDVYNPFQPDVMNVYEIKKRYGDQFCFYGGISIQNLLPFGTPQQIKSEVQHMIHKIGKGGGYILAPSHAVLADTPVENMVAFIEAVQNQ